MINYDCKINNIKILVKHELSQITHELNHKLLLEKFMKYFVGNL